MSWWAVGAAVVGTVVSSDSARSAANKQQDAANQAADAQRYQYDQTRTDMAPWREAGGRALTALESGINEPLNGSTVMSDPGYQFGLDQGMRALDRRQAAMGGRVSGAALKAAAQYGTDYATTKYDAAYQRRQDRLNRLAALAGLGQTSTAQTGQFGAQAALNAGAFGTMGANAGAAGSIAQGNIWSNGMNQIAALYGRNSTRPPVNNGANAGGMDSGTFDRLAQYGGYGG